MNVTPYTDSFLATQAILLNHPDSPTKPVNRLDELTGVFDLALLRIPKNLSFFEDILSHLSRRLRAGAPVVCGAMLKYLAKGCFPLLDQYIGPTTTSLAKKKARLVFANFSRSPDTKRPYPRAVRIEPFPGLFENHSNVFSAEKLDIGTRFLLEHFPMGSFRAILDLGCGNGLLGIAAALRFPGAALSFSDESAMAIESARNNFLRFFPERKASFHWTHCCAPEPDASRDLVLCNPPFHSGGPLSDAVAREMFADAHRVLVPGGILRVIGNTHLNYPSVLKTLFGHAQKVAANDKFTIVDARK